VPPPLSRVQYGSVSSVMASQDAAANTGTAAHRKRLTTSRWQRQPRGGRPGAGMAVVSRGTGHRRPGTVGREIAPHKAFYAVLVTNETPGQVGPPAT
jgi:hypothetical protein